MNVRLAFGMCVFALLARSALAQNQLPASLTRVGIDQRLEAQVPADLRFREESGNSVRLGNYFNGRPVVLALVQYRCPMLCNQILLGLIESLRRIPLNVGSDFEVVVVSFDAREQPDLAAAKREAFIQEYGRPGAEAGWHFLTGEQPAIDALTQTVGFRYVYDAKTDQFAHASAIIVLTPDGKTARYLFGVHYPPRDLRLSLIEASRGKIGAPADRLLLLCYHYDLTTGRYTPAVMNFVRAGGVLTMLTLGMFFVYAWRRRRSLKFKVQSH